MKEKIKIEKEINIYTIIVQTDLYRKNIMQTDDRHHNKLKDLRFRARV